MSIGKNLRSFCFASCVFAFLIAARALVFAEMPGAAFLYLNKSAALAGMGNPNAIFTEYPTAAGNPALYGPALLRQLSFGGGSDPLGASLSRMSLDTRIKNTGVGFSYFGYDLKFDYINPGGFEEGGIWYSGGATSLSSGFQLYPNLYGGLSFEHVKEDMGSPTAQNMDEDSALNMGLLYQRGRFNAGFMQKNLNGGGLSASEAKLPSTTRLSFGWVGERFKTAMTFGGDQFEDYASFGFEWKLSPWLALRMGSETYGTADAIPSFGFGIKYGSYGFDFASVQHDTLGATSLTSFNYFWGMKKEAKPPAPSKPEPAAPDRMMPREEPKPAEIPVLPAMPEGERMNIAVTDFEARAPLSQSEAAFISDFVRSDIVRSGRFNVIDKNNMDKVLAEQGFQQTGCSSAECAVAIGKILNVKYMAVGSCGQLLGKYIITMNIVDVESAKIIFSDDVSVANPDDLRKVITELIGNFTGSVK